MSSVSPPAYVLEAALDSSAQLPPLFLPADSSSFANFPVEIVGLIIVAGGSVSSKGQLTRGSFQQSPQQSTTFLRMCSLVSPSFRAVAQRMLFRQAYLFGEFAVTPFLKAVEAKGWSEGIRKVVIRNLGKHGNTGGIEKLLGGLPNLRRVEIDGKEEYYSKLSGPKQDFWLRKVDSESSFPFSVIVESRGVRSDVFDVELESLSLFYTSHLLENAPTMSNNLPLSLPNLRSLSLTTGNFSASTGPLIAACPNLESLSLVDRCLKYEALVNVISALSPTLTTLRLNSDSRPAGEDLTALRAILSNCSNVQSLTVDVAALHSPSPLPSSLTSLEITAGQVAERHRWVFQKPESSEEDRENVRVAVLEGRCLRAVEVEASLWSEALEVMCEERGIDFRVADFGRC